MQFEHLSPLVLHKEGSATTYSLDTHL